ncbi:HNH endonuclease signature motif containing protein [Arthrobacter crystallopoietes]|uniref:HNH nuclease domain-containing protein n=1 Tax=Crystallibacter crystallopoietes TaxID=37928 RepID=A0A1H0ZAH8_9MICC|nr:HNH endonuclease signature motif containing protein [Arthrobacter crystallopoietes]SDQ24412.1 protein of unknown function [Arthrobacter crystallopoietes]
MAAEEHSPDTGSPADGHVSAGPVPGQKSVPSPMPGDRRPRDRERETVVRREDGWSHYRGTQEKLRENVAHWIKRRREEARERLAAGLPPRSPAMAKDMEELRAKARAMEELSFKARYPDPALSAYGPDPLAEQDIPRPTEEPLPYDGEVGFDDFAPWDREPEWACRPLVGPVPVCWGPAEELGDVPAELFTEDHAEYYAHRLSRIAAGGPAEWFRLFGTINASSTTNAAGAVDAANAADAVAAATTGGVASEASALAGVDELDYQGAVEHLVAGRRLVAWVQACMVRLAAHVGDAALAQLPPPREGAGPDVTGPLQDLADQSAAEELACLYRITELEGRQTLQQARELCAHYPGTLAALSAGEMDLDQATVIVRQGETLPDGQKPGYEGALLAKAGQQTPRQLLYAARKERESRDPDSLAKRHAQAVKRRNVCLEPDGDGMVTLRARVSAETGLAIHNRLTDAARSLQTEAETRTVGQLRADVFADLLLHAGMETGPAAGIRPEVALTVPVFTLLGLDDEPATLEGYGPIPADVARRLCQDAPSFHRILTHPETGAVLSYGKTTYKPPADLARAVRHRDPVCAGPGCTAAARDCELDHTIEYHGNGGHGETDYINLGPLCKLLHRLKSHAGWKIIQTGPGEFTTTTPGNQKYTTRPGDFRDTSPPTYPDTVLDNLPDDHRQRLRPKPAPPWDGTIKNDPPPF